MDIYQTKGTFAPHHVPRIFSEVEFADETVEWRTEFKQPIDWFALYLLGLGEYGTYGSTESVAPCRGFPTKSSGEVNVSKHVHRAYRSWRDTKKTATQREKACVYLTHLSLEEGIVAQDIYRKECGSISYLLARLIADMSAIRSLEGGTPRVVLWLEQRNS